MRFLDASNLVDPVRHHARARPERTAFTFAGHTEAVDDDEVLTYGQLDHDAGRIAAALAELVPVDEPVLLLLPPGADYVRALFACLYAGRIAVPAPPPFMERGLQRLGGIIRDSGARLALVGEPHRRRLHRLFAEEPELARLEWRTPEELMLAAHAGLRANPRADQVALVQYTSGSTLAPRGVLLSHANLLHNAGAIHARFGTEEASTGVFWLPPYHDMGLIGSILQPVLVGGRAHLLSPLDFLKHPLRWLEEISRRGATISGAPNFAYDLCAVRM